MTNEQIARVCYDANRGYQAAVPTVGIPVGVPWDEFPADQQRGVISGVEMARGGAQPDELHESWTELKVKDGWVYGDVKDADAKTHPCLLPYAELPPEQRVKDVLFAAVVQALS